MTIQIIKKLHEQRVTIEKGCSYVNGCYRKVVLISLDRSDEIEVTLSGDDALRPLKEGQKVLVDLRCHRYRMNGENYNEYYVMSIWPLEDDVRIEYQEDWTTRLV